MSKKTTDKLEELSEKKVPLLYFLPLRILMGIAWIYWSILAFTPQTLFAVVAFVAGVLLIIGLFARLGAFLGTLIAYIAYFASSFSKVAPIAIQGLSNAAWPFLFVGITLMFWASGRVLGLDKVVIEKAPFFAKIRFS